MECQRKTGEGKAYDFGESEVFAECLFFVMHRNITDEKYLFRNKGGRHNRHARRERPDLLVKRHIVDGKDINRDG